MSAVGGKRVEIGLGAEAAVSLAGARKVAVEMREAVALGQNPKTIMKPEAEPDTPKNWTFSDFAEEYISSIEAGWKNPVHRQQWRQSLRDHAHLISSKALPDITTDDLLAVLQPIWLTKPQTASRVRGRIERILDAAKVRGFIPRDQINPARLKGHLDFLLAKQPKLIRGHHAALPYQDLPIFMAALATRPAIAARCLEFTILTAARSGEALGATWGEIDLESRIWRVPASRMKAGAEHVVPLSDLAMSILTVIKNGPVKPDDLLFGVKGAARSNMAMTMLLRRMGFGHITTHGFRSTFRDWAGDLTHHSREVVETALAHTIQSKVEQAYRRGNALEKRRQLMDDWAKFIAGSSETTPLPKN
jgi:integrase